MVTYKELLATFNHHMLAGHDDRAAFLSSIHDCFNRPDESFHVIHIAGTNGKGSTGTVLVNALQAAGYHVGYFSSPALLDEREMIRVDGQMIAKDEFVRTYQALAQRLPHDVKPTDLTVFEWWTFIALQYFKERQVDWAVIECGMGGQDDSTNVISAPDLAIISHLSLDHTNILGPKIADIAQSASGIIKAGTRACVLANHQDPAAFKIVKETCNQQGVPLIEARSSVQVSLARKKFDVTKGMPIAVDGGHFDQVQMNTSLLGSFQLDNLTTTATVYNYLIDHHLIKDDLSPFVQAVKITTIPGRMQRVNKRPLTFLDAAHNPDGAQALLRTCQQCFQGKNFIFVLGFLTDKDWKQMASMYRQVAKRIIVTTPNNPKRALPARTLAAKVPGSQVIEKPLAALQQAQSMASDQDVVIATGSFYLVKELLPQVTSGQEHSHLDQRSSY